MVQLSSAAAAILRRRVATEALLPAATSCIGRPFHGTRRERNPIPEPVPARWRYTSLNLHVAGPREQSNRIRPPIQRSSLSSRAADNVWLPSLGISVGGHSSTVDPFTLVAEDLERATQSIRSTVSVLQHPVLDRAASHLFSLHGKRLRPIIVILMAHATAVLKPSPSIAAAPSASTSVVPSGLLPGPIEGAMTGVAQIAGMLAASSPFGNALEKKAVLPTVLLDSQLRLAEITEMIHAASLLHDDVIDTADSRRGLPTVNSMFGNQLAVLAGDFLLARASVALARLRDCDVVELLSTVIEHLVRGEVIQMNGANGKAAGADGRSAGMGGIGDVSEEDSRRQRHYHHPEGLFESYMAKTFFKTASLMANSCRAVTMLAGHSREAADAAYVYGEHVGIAFQLVDDMLDFTGSQKSIGKPVLNDLKQGHATAPVLFALNSYPNELRPMIARRFKKPGDVEATVALVESADSINQTRELAVKHARTAISTLSDNLPPSDARSALINLADHVLTRRY